MKQVLSIIAAFFVALLTFGVVSQTSSAETTATSAEEPEKKLVATKIGKAPVGAEIGGLKVVETDLNGKTIAEYNLRQIAGKPDKERGDKNLRPGQKSVTTQSITAQGTYCKRVRAWVTARSTLGVVRYRWHLKKRWCYNGYRVLKGSIRHSQWATNIDSLTTWHKNWLVKRGGFRDGGWRHWSKRQTKTTHYIPRLGKIGTNYPWVAINSRANGSYSVGRGYR